MIHLKLKNNPATVIAFVGWFAVFATGCRRDEIHSYEIPNLPEATEGEPTHRMLGAMLRGPDRAWFVKATATVEQTAGIEDGYNAFLNSLRIDEDSGEPSWELPEGWTDRGGSGIRLTTLVAAADPEEANGDPIEVTITGLSMADDWDALVLDNLNRWRGQMKLPPISPGELTAHTSKLASAPEGSVAVDLEGWFDSSGAMRAPFAGGGAIPAVPPKRSRPTPSLEYEKPAGWVEEPGSLERLASFRTGSGDEAALATAFAFPNVLAMSDPLANINRWRGEIGLAPTNTEELQRNLEAIELDGAEAQYIELTGDEKSTFAVMAVRGELVWFLKLTGAPSVVNENKDAFNKWVESVRLSPGDDSAD